MFWRKKKKIKSICGRGPSCKCKDSKVEKLIKLSKLPKKKKRYIVKKKVIRRKSHKKKKR